MEETRNSEETSPVEFSSTTSLSSKESAHIDSEPPTSPILNGKLEPDPQSTVIKDSEISSARDTLDSSENMAELGPKGIDIISGYSEADIPLPTSETSKAQISDIPLATEDGAFNGITNFQVDGVKPNNAPSEIRDTEDNLHIVSDELHQPQVEVASVPNKTPEPIDHSEHGKHDVNRGLVDTAAPFESVREAVTKFGGIVDWKAHKIQTVERRKHVELELEKVNGEIPTYKKQSEAAEDAKTQALMELDSTKRLIEELKLNLERAQTEEDQAKQDSELARLRVEEMEQGIADEASVAAKAQLELAKARHVAAVAELKSVKDELEALRREYVSLVNERDVAVRKAEAAQSASKEIEKTVEELTLELIAAKETLESAHAAHLEAEEQRIASAMTFEQDSLNWERELKQAEEELQRLNDQLLSVKDLQSKQDAASQLLLNLKAELSAYMEAKLNQETDSTEKEENQTDTQAAIASAKKEHEEVMLNLEKAKDDVACLRVAAVSLQSELQREKAALASMRQREGMASVAVASLEAELNTTKSELELVQMKEKEAREKMVDLPKAIQQAAQEADLAKSAAKLAREELRKAKEEAEQVEACVSTTESRLHASLKEIEAAKASERLALAAVKALQESELAVSTEGEDTPNGVTLSLDEYYALSKMAHEAEENANKRVAAALSEIKVAKDSELRNLEKLEEANKELRARKEALTIAMEKAEKAKQGKLGVEQELRKWRAEHEQRRKASDAAPDLVNTVRSPQRNIEERKEPKSFVREQNAAPIPSHPVSSQKVFMPGNNVENLGPEMKVKKKRSFFPRIVMFLARRKANSTK
ncbi:protein WEAK CHLOROPLAST MOVEMENT UNDER BLUE LIGHT 1-like [Tasmannia lanceolata]|uniref:protein WEAK CHLOROPLAST MOVEMENT UNDER BLUE LIGHT 1-like n=1 Tax=Tasmannia lanceolata TaxID=3420 RepID=UPI0040627F92